MILLCRPVLLPMAFLAVAGLQAQVLPTAAPAAAPADVLIAVPVSDPAPETLHEKFMDYAVNTVGPFALVSPAASAAVRLAHPPAGYPHVWTDGANAFGRNYGNDLADKASLETGRFVVGAVLHEDFRYRPSGSRNKLVRVGHAFAFTFVDRSDSGHRRIAMANFVAAGAGGLVGEFYLPPSFRDVTHAESRIVVELGRLTGGYLLQEFAPEINSVARTLHIPMGRSFIPDWWVKR